MKFKITLCVILIIFLSSFSFPFDTFGRKTGLLSLHRVTVEDRLLGYGVSYEYFFLDNFSVDYNLLVGVEGFIGGILPSLDFAWHFSLPAVSRLEFMIGGGATLAITYEGGIFLRLFSGARYFISPKIGSFIKILMYPKSRFESTGVVLGITFKIR